MLVLEAPYVSETMIQWLEESQHPVLANDFASSVAESGANLNLVPADDASCILKTDEMVYTSSENALDWVIRNTGNEDLANCIALCKDKAATRRAMAKVDPSVFFAEYTLQELANLDPDQLSFPVVVKPSIGFISFGVHVVPSANDWSETIDVLKKEIEAGSVFPGSVISDKAFIVEGFITGQEYAVDVYFDDDQKPVILNVMQHDFLNSEDTSDHFYFTSKTLMKAAAPALREWFARTNAELGFRNFCTHVELRVTQPHGESALEAITEPENIHVIEFNPLRFAGLCGTDLSYFAYGFRTYENYLANRKPDWNSICENDDLDYATCFAVVEKPDEWSSQCSIDYGKLKSDFESMGASICDLRTMNPDVHGISCFPIFKVASERDFSTARDFCLNIDADDYLLC